MKPRVVHRAVALATVFSLILYGSIAGAADPPKRPQQEAFEKRIVAEMQAESADGAAIFVEATAARDRGDLEAAKKGFERAHEALPRSSHPLRRLCHVELNLKARDRAVEHCRAALAMQESAPNLAALALTLVQGGTMTEQREAYDLANRAATMDPNDETSLVAQAGVSLDTQHEDTFKKALARLKLIAPDLAMTSYFSAIDAAMRGEWSESDEEIDHAIARGMSAESMEGLRSRIHESHPLYLKVWHAVKFLGSIWISIAAFLFLGGMILSKAAARSARNLPTESTGHARGMDAFLRKAYRVLLWFACAFYYASIPLVLGLVTILGGGLIYAFFALGRIPIKLVLVVAVITLTTLWAVVKSLFVRPADTDPGKRLDLSAHPRFKAVLDEVASKVGTRPVDEVYLTPGTDIAVFERGGMWKSLRGARVERCLVLGIGVLQGMRLTDFKAILAHEHGHFQNEDTAGGGFALAVRRSVLSTAIGLAKGGVATWYNPAWWFVRGFFLLFLRISQGASRLQEVLADRWAAFCYGARAFERGLRHAIERGAAFEVEANVKINDVLKAKRAMLNLYSYEPSEPMKEGLVADDVKQAIEREASPYDSHPAPLERIALVRRLQGTPLDDDDETQALDLFENRERLEQMMTDEVRSQVILQTGVTIPAVL